MWSYVANYTNSTSYTALCYPKTYRRNDQLRHRSDQLRHRSDQLRHRSGEVLGQQGLPIDSV